MAFISLKPKGLNTFTRLVQHVGLPIARRGLANSGDSSNLFNVSLTDDQREFKDLINTFMKKELPNDVVSQMDKKDNFPAFKELWKKLGSLGIHGVTAPKKYGGLGLGYLDHCLAMEVFSQYSASLALSYGAHSNLHINQLCLNGTDEQKERFLPKLIDGSFVGALAMSEANSGSDVTSMRTKAVKKRDYYELTGSKFWITNGPLADVVLVYAKTNEKDITAFLVEKGMDGFSVGKKIDKMGMRGSPTSELIFEECKIPAKNIVGGLNRGVYVLMSGLDYERLVLAAGPLGIMQRACDVAFSYAHERQQFGQHIGKFQLLQGLMADMYTETLFCRNTLYSVASELDRKQTGSFNRSNVTVKCAAIILRLAESACQVADTGLQLLGGNGYTEDYEMSRLLRDARLYRIGAGTSEIRRWLIGREINKAYLN